MYIVHTTLKCMIGRRFISLPVCVVGWCCGVSSRTCGCPESSPDSWSARCWVAVVTCSATVSCSCTSDKRCRVSINSSLVLFSSCVVCRSCFCNSITLLFSSSVPDLASARILVKGGLSANVLLSSRSAIFCRCSFEYFVASSRDRLSFLIVSESLMFSLLTRSSSDCDSIKRRVVCSYFSFSCLFSRLWFNSSKYSRSLWASCSGVA